MQRFDPASAKPTVIWRGDAFVFGDSKAIPVAGRIGGQFYAGIEKISSTTPVEVSWEGNRYPGQSLAEEGAEIMAQDWYNLAWSEEDAKRLSAEGPSIQIDSFGPWYTSDDGLSEAQLVLGHLNEDGKLTYYSALQISYQGGDPGEVGWVGPFETPAQAQSSAKEALESWRYDEPEPSDALTPTPGFP